MMNSSSSSNTSRIIPRWVIALVLAISFVGILDASYLTAEHYSNVIPPCTVFQGCENVLTSQYAEVFGIPVALFGAVFYLSIFVLSLLYLDTKKKKFLNMLIPVTVLGFLATLYFLYLQAFVIHSWCQYCVLSATTSALLFISGVTIWRYANVRTLE